MGEKVVGKKGGKEGPSVIYLQACFPKPIPRIKWVTPFAK